MQNFKEDTQENSHYYREYFSFEGLVDKLILNRILNAKSAARVRVHYNFLSGFTHHMRKASKEFSTQIGFAGIHSVRFIITIIANYSSYTSAT